MIEPAFEDALGFSEGLAGVMVGKRGEDGRWGFIDTTGRMVIPPQYGAVRSFEDGLARMSPPTEELIQLFWGYIDRTGKVVWMRER